MGVGGQHHAPAALYLRERPDTHCTGGWLGAWAGLDRCGKSFPHRDSIPGPSLCRLSCPGPYYNIMGAPSHKRSVVDRNVAVRRMTVFWRRPEMRATVGSGLF
jgi:hypothetical protein